MQNRLQKSPWWRRDRHTDRRPFLLARGRIQSAIRRWFESEGFLEVDTAAVQVSPGNETHLHAFATELIAPDGTRRPLYLHTSPEFACKKLLAAGERKIFTFAPVFRNRERGALHHPAFTMLEWYRAEEPYERLMDDCAALLRVAAEAAGADAFSHRNRTADPFVAPERLTVAEAFQRYAGIDLLATVIAMGSDPSPPRFLETLSSDARGLTPGAGMDADPARDALARADSPSPRTLRHVEGVLSARREGRGEGRQDTPTALGAAPHPSPLPTEEWGEGRKRSARDALARAAVAAGIKVADDDTWGDIFSRVLVEKIEPNIGNGRATLLTEYPALQAALARPKPTDPRVAERFELYACGVELANAFGELTDPAEQRRRFELEMAEKQRIHGDSYPIDEDFLAALAHMPPASGAALGFDRLAMLATGAAHIEQVIWTPVVE